MLAPGRRRSQPGTLPMRKLTSLTSCRAGAALPWWTSRQTDGNADVGESPGEAGDACAIPAIRAMWVVPSTGAAQDTTPRRRLDTIRRFFGRRKRTTETQRAQRKETQRR